MGYRTLIVVASMIFCVNAAGNAIHQDSRCNCICPDPPKNDSSSNPSQLKDEDFHIGLTRKIYINSSVSPDNCNCVSVVLTQLNLTDAQADSFCPRCLCKYQTRSLTIIKVVVILVVWVVLLLLFYMGFLSLLEPILSKKRGAGLLRSGMSGPGLVRGTWYLYFFIIFLLLSNFLEMKRKT